MGAHRLPLITRIFQKVDMSAAGDGCWPWLGALSTKRRGQRRPIIKVGGNNRPRGSCPVQNVARLVCAMWNGPAPTPEHEARHICPHGENDRCVRPGHLVWMTRIENEQHKQRMRVHVSSVDQSTPG